MAPRLRINGYRRIQQVMELVIVAQGDSVNTLGMCMKDEPAWVSAVTRLSAHALIRQQGAITPIPS